MKSFGVMTLVLFVIGLPACGKRDEHKEPKETGEKAHQHASEEGPHGGHLVELAPDHHLEVIHDAKAGTIRAYLFGADGKTPARTSKAPELKLSTKEGPKVLPLQAVGAAPDGSSEFMLTDPLLKAEHLEGRITVEIGGRTFNPDLESTHHHGEKGH